jgi:hypothetical protein
MTAGVLVGTFGLELITALPSNNRYWALSVPLLVLLAVGLLTTVFPATQRDEASPIQTVENETPGTGNQGPSADLHRPAMMPAPPR